MACVSSVCPSLARSLARSLACARSLSEHCRSCEAGDEAEPARVWRRLWGCAFSRTEAGSAAAAAKAAKRREGSGRRHYEERKSRRNLVSGSDAVVLWALAVFVSLCVPAGANHAPNGTAATRKVVVFGNENLGATATTGMTSWCFANRCSSLDTYQIVAGELVEVNITASSTAVNGNLTMSVLADPGLPSGCRVTATEKLEVGGGIKAYMKRLSFTPITGQEGLVYRICVKATDTDTPTPNDFVTKCIRIDVRAPQIAFKTGTALTVERSVGVNCPVLLTLLPYDEGNKGYCLEMFPGKNSDPSQGTLPGGAQLTHVGTEARAKHGTHDGCAHNEWLLAWYPTRGQEANTYTYCVHARDTRLSPPPLLLPTPPSLPPRLLHPCRDTRLSSLSFSLPKCSMHEVASLCKNIWAKKKMCQKI